MTLKVYIFILSQFLLIENIRSGGDSPCEDDCVLINAAKVLLSRTVTSARTDIFNAFKLIFGVLGESAYLQAEPLAKQLRDAETQEEKDNLKRLLAEITYDSNNGEKKKAMEEAISRAQDKLDELAAMLAIIADFKKPDCSQCNGVQRLLNIAPGIINPEQSRIDLLQNIVECTTPI